LVSFVGSRDRNANRMVDGAEVRAGAQTAR
jgi:hypothetical protein